jgi:hypothetical protein
MRLFHFTDDPTIKVFEPRPVQVPVGRPKGFEWLNGALVWAIDEARGADVSISARVSTHPRLGYSEYYSRGSRPMVRRTLLSGDCSHRMGMA